MLRRLFGGRGPANTQVFDARVASFDRLRDDASIQVVGESYRQQNLSSARPPGPGDLPPAVPPPPPGYLKAILVPEPSNEYDRNAVMVLLWASGTWIQVGYLSRGHASDFQPLFRHIAAAAGGKSPAIACDAALVSEGTSNGVVLHLGSPAECIAELVTDGRVPTPGHPWAGQNLAFTGQLATTIHGVPIDRLAQVMIARWAGCRVVPRLTKRTNALVVADADQITGNLQRATEYGVPIVAEADYLVAVGIPIDAIGRRSGRWAGA